MSFGIKRYPPYKIYRALITQTSNNAPTAVVLENTLGQTPVYAYGGIGSYTLTASSNIFLLAKTVIQHNGVIGVVTSGDLMSAVVSSDTIINIDTTHNGGASDDLLSNSQLTILIYP